MSNPNSLVAENEIIDIANELIMLLNSLIVLVILLYLFILVMAILFKESDFYHCLQVSSIK